MLHFCFSLNINLFLCAQRFLTIMQWQSWLGESPIHLASLTQQVTWMSFKVSVFLISVTLNKYKNNPVSVVIVVLRSGGLWQAASSQLSTDRCVPCMFLCCLPLIIWKCQREGQFQNIFFTDWGKTWPWLLLLNVSQVLVCRLCLTDLQD